MNLQDLLHLYSQGTTPERQQSQDQGIAGSLIQQIMGSGQQQPSEQQQQNEVGNQMQSMQQAHSNAQASPGLFTRYLGGGNGGSSGGGGGGKTAAGGIISALL